MDISREIQQTILHTELLKSKLLTGLHCNPRDPNANRKMAIAYTGRSCIGIPIFNSENIPIYCLRFWKQDDVLKSRKKEKETCINISEVLNKLVKRHDLKFFVQYQFLNEGLVIDEQRIIPCILMDWAGETLADKLYPGHDSNGKPKSKPSKDQYKMMADSFAFMCQKMKEAGIVHGDLSSNNIVVTNDWHLKLIDYDSIYIPSEDVVNTQSSVGTKGFQHPGRFSAKKKSTTDDNFSQLIIYLTLLTYYYNPQLNNVQDKIEEMLFSDSDLQSADKFRDSLAYKEIKKFGNQELLFYLEIIENSLSKPYTEVPFLCDLINERKEEILQVQLANFCGICGHHFDNNTDKYCPDCGAKREKII